MAKRPLGEPKLPPDDARRALAAMPWFARFSLTAGGLGFARFAPGTWGSLPPCIMVAILAATLPAGDAWIIQAALVLLLAWSSVACVRYGNAAEALLKLKDPSCIVCDEVAGMSIALLGFRWPLRDGGTPGWWWQSGVIVAGAFLAFRALDVLKPPPCRQIQAIHAGWGILLDDIIAGVYACLIMHLAIPASW